MKKKYFRVLFGLLLVYAPGISTAQICDPSVPLFNVNLTGSPAGSWTSPSVFRNGLCCSASGADVCVEFIVTLDSMSNGISFDIISGAVPGGALYYQVNCGAPAALGSPICLSGVGPHYITFCKPGNNNNVYQITSIPQPSAGGTRYVSQACTGNMYALGLDESTITWTSVPFNATYNSYLSCSSNCDSVTIALAGAGFPPYVDYQVCGNVVGACGTIAFCDTIRVNFVNDLAVTITPQNPTICFGGANAVVTAQPSGGVSPYSYLWSTGDTSRSISVGVGTYVVQMTDLMSCMTVSDTVTVNALPNPIDANAGMDILFCNGTAQSVQLNGAVIAATGGIWTGGSGTFNPDDTTLNSIYTPSASEISAGVANLRLVTTGNSGCPPDSDDVAITIAPQPDPQITGSLTVCQFGTFVYQASCSSPVSYSWLVSNGTLVNTSTNTLTVQWNTAGTGTITLTASNSAGCDSTISVQVTVNPQPVPVLAGAASACTPVTEVYHVTLPTSNNYSWTVMGGTIIGSLSADSLVVLWNSSGTGVVTVTESNVSGCDSTVSMQVALSATPSPAISGQQNLCGLVSSLYTASPSNAVTHTWTINGGSILSNNGDSIMVQWTTTGSNSITLTATNASGCDTTITYLVNVYPQPNPVLNGPSAACTPVTNVYHVATPTSNNYNWTVMGGTILGSSVTDSLVVSWNSSGTGVVTLTETNTYGCDTTVMMQVALSATPTPSIAGQQNLCGLVASLYTASASNAVAYNWTINGGNIISNNGDSIMVQWTTTGSNSITLTATNASGCDTTITYPVSVYPQPNPVLAGPTSACTPVTQVFHVTIPTANNYFWTVMGGTILGSSVTDSLVVAWNSSGTGVVTLTESNVYGCDTTVMMQVALSATPTPSIAGQQNLCGLVASLYTASASNAVAHNWTINGGTIINNNGDSILVQWTATGSNSITLTATNAFGCDTTITYPVNVYPQPNPVLTGASSACTPVNNVYHVANPTTDTYSWSVVGGFIQGVNSADSVVVRWTASGTGIITLNQSNIYGCDTTVSMQVALSATPILTLSGPQTICGTFPALYITSPSSAVSFIWNVTGGSIVADHGDSVMVLWNTIGSNSVSVTASNAWGCDTVITFPVNVYPQPAPVITGSNSACTPTTSTFRVSSPNTTGYNWSVTNGNIIGSNTSDSIIVHWDVPGMGTITVTASNNYGCDSTTSMNVALSSTPTPVITGQQTFCGLLGAMYNAGISNAVNYNWSISGGNIVSDLGDSALIQWNQTGNGNITLTATNAAGCDTVLQFPVTIYPQPSPSVTGPASACTPVANVFQVTNPSGNNYNWTVSNGTISGSSTLDSVLVVWNSSGIGTVNLTETNSFGCDTTVTNYITLYPYPDPVLAGRNSVCIQDTATYSVQDIPGHTYQWTVNGGGIIGFAVGSSIEVQWYSTGNGSVSVKQTSPDHCEATATEQVYVNPNPVPVITGTPVVCDGQTAFYAANPGSSYSYTWFVSGGTFVGTASQGYANVQWQTAGQGVLTVQETDGNGCVSSQNFFVLVNPLPAVSIMGSQVGCVNPYGGTYLSTNLPNIIYQWSAIGGSVTHGNGTSQADIRWNVTGINQVTVHVTNTLTGCSNTSNLQVVVDSMQAPSITANSMVGCAPFHAQLNGNPSFTNYSYLWTFGDGLASTSVSPLHDYTLPGTYSIMLIVSNNTACVDTAYASVMVFNTPLAAFDVTTTDDFYPSDLTDIQLHNSSAGAVSYLWSFGNGDFSTDFEPVYQYNTAGEQVVQLVVINSNGCRDSMLTTLHIKAQEELYIPNAFSPNGDSRNDFFSVKYKNITDLKVTVMNRWGEVVYSSSDKDFAWDGTYYGKGSQTGVYVYVIKATGYEGKHYDKIGTVSLVR